MARERDVCVRGLSSLFGFPMNLKWLLSEKAGLGGTVFSDWSNRLNYLGTRPRCFVRESVEFVEASGCFGHALFAPTKEHDALWIMSAFRNRSAASGCFRDSCRGGEPGGDVEGGFRLLDLRWSISRSPRRRPSGLFFQALRYVGQPLQ